MKIIQSIFHLILITLVLTDCRMLLAQVQMWENPIKFTSNYNDRNPHFGTKQLGFNSEGFTWEFLVFERWTNVNTSQICVLKIGMDGVIDPVKYLTLENSEKRNPSISYDYSYSPGSHLKNSLVLWEQKYNNRWNIYGCFYRNNVWSNSFAVDTTNVDMSMPRSLCLDSTNFIIVYQKVNDIFLKKLNTTTQQILLDTNLTFSEQSNCRNAFVSRQNRIAVSYEKEKPNNEFAIEFQEFNTVPALVNKDTTAYSGNNINNGFANFWEGLTSIFSSNRLGNYNLYYRKIGNVSLPSQDSLFVDRNSHLNNFDSYFFPLVFDQNGFGYTYHSGAHILREQDSVKIKFSNFRVLRDSTVVGDTSVDCSLTINNGIKFGQSYDIIVWCVFNKDTVEGSILYARRNLVITGGIEQIGNEIPSKLSLYQNYPNPFNPETKIKFNVPVAGKITLSIYDVLGNEFERLVDEILPGGQFEITWNAGNYPSGIYFYKLSSDNFSQTKKMILLK